MLDELVSDAELMDWLWLHVSTQRTWTMWTVISTSLTSFSYIYEFEDILELLLFIGFYHKFAVTEQDDERRVWGSAGHRNADK